VSLEDILEELVGEIRDEYDQEEEPIRIVEKSENYVKAIVVNDVLDLDLEAEEVDTIAGFVLLQLQHFPEVGSALTKCLSNGKFRKKISLLKGLKTRYQNI